MERVVSATEARIRFGELMRRAVENDETIIVERGGEAHVVVLSVEEYERLRERQKQENWRYLVDSARAQVLSDLGGRTLPSPAEVLAQMREGRDEQLVALR